MHGGAWTGGHDHGRRSRSDAHRHSDAHAHAHSHAHAHAPSPLSRLIHLRESPRIAAAAAAMLLSAAVLPLPLLASRLLLAASLALTGLPALAEAGSRAVASNLRDVDADALMTLAAAAAVASGAAAEGALLTTLYAASHAVEHAVTARARRDLDDLRDLAPTLALRVPSAAAGLGSAAPADRVPVAELAVGDFVLVRAGEVVPCDGEVVDGAAFVAVQHVTGEARPRAVAKGDAVPAGARAVDAPLVVCVGKVGAESTMARISRLVVSAQANRPRATRFFDRYTRAYTQAVLSVAVLLAVMLPVGVAGMRYGGKAGSLQRALGFLVASSPCALVIGAPVAYLAALSASARRGILVKSGPRALDATATARHIVFDKTGTLTTGDLALVDVLVLPPSEDWPDAGPPSVGDVVPVAGAEAAALVGVAAALERGAVHPIADAILGYHEAAVRAEGGGGGGGGGVQLTGRKTVPGQGVEALEDSAVVRLGRMSFVLPGEPRLAGFFDAVSDDGGMVVTALSRGGRVYVIRLRDEVRPEARGGVELLKKQGLAVSLLTGDGLGAARLVEHAVGGLDSVVANATPESKLERIRALHGRGKPLDGDGDFGDDEGDGEGAPVNGGVVMVGDAMNDAAALAAATVGIACGLSSAAAVQAADVVLVRSDLRDVAWYVRKANATQIIVKQNLAIALALMLLAVVPTLAGAVPLWLAVTLHEGGTVLVGLNGLRLLSDRLS